MLYLDSADRVGLAPLLASGLFAGITTNPLILHRAGLSAADLPDLVSWARDHGCRRFFAQATGTTLEELRESAHGIIALGEDVVVKLVSTPLGLTLARRLASERHDVLVTAAYHPSQMLLATAAGARFIAPYVRRATEAGRDGIALVRLMAQLGNEGSPRILAASLGGVDQVVEAMTAGAHDATLSIAVATAMLHDELTLTATAEFEEFAR